MSNQHPSRATTLLQRLRRELKQTYPHWRVEDVTVGGSGLDALVCRANSRALGPLAIRIPWKRWIINDNDRVVDARVLLQQEAALTTHARAYGVSTPRAYELHFGDDDFDFLASEFIEHDGSAPDDHAFGQLMRAIHTCPPTSLPLVMQGTTPIADLLAERLARRAIVVERLTGARFHLPDQQQVRALLEWPTAQRSILHMDARPANLLTRAGAIVAAVDWSDALLGDPALELARIAEVQGVTDAFLAGYGLAQPFARVPPNIEVLYRLDGAVMLAVVFLSEAPDPQRAAIQVRRVHTLAHALVL